MRRAAAPLDVLPLLAGILLALLLLAGCGDADAPDAYGNFEADEVTVSAEAQGRLLRFDVREGDRLAAGAVVGLIDTTRLAAQRDALRAQRRSLLGQQRALRAQEAATRAQAAEADAAAGALAAQLATAETELERTRRLVAGEAATARELSEREGAVAALRRQVEGAHARGAAVGAQAGVPAAQAAAVDDQVAGLDAELRRVATLLADARVTNPTAGTVLSVVAEAGEAVQPGAPLYTVADLRTLTLRAYATGDQLARLRLRMPVEVRVDDPAAADGLRVLPGEVAWIAADAQFTPTPIQTRDERAELVYAFDVRVANPDGLLKVGMPGEVRFPDDAPERTDP